MNHTFADMKTLRARLQSEAEPRYRDFTARLIPRQCRLLGVRLPKLRALAKQLAQQGIWRLPTPADAYMEELMLRGMVIGYVRGVAPAALLAELEHFVPLIANWSVCDSCCATYAFARRNREAVWEWLRQYWASEDEFKARFGVVMLLNHFCRDAGWASRVAAALPAVPARGYYAEMAVAWCACELIIHHPHLADSLGASLRPGVHKLMLRKLRESRRSPRL